jgi:predicted nucleic acid-binding protein
VIPPALLDSSAWARLNDARLSRFRKREVREAFERLRLSVCLPFLLEAGFSARSALDHRRVMTQLLALPRMEINAASEERAIEAQTQLASAAHHRIPPADLMIAALADHNRVAILHYDHHYDSIAEKTDLQFQSLWLAEPGSL